MPSPHSAPDAPLSVYVLTFNSEKYLHPLLSRVRPVADDLLVVDSGSTDQTVAIAERYGCRVLHRPMDNFRNQRAFAVENCQHRTVLMLDSDEIPDERFVQHLAELKTEGFPLDAYRFNREWYVMGRKIHCLYPVRCPDQVVRVVKKDLVRFDDRSRTVHERPFGHQTLGAVHGVVAHYTFETRAELFRKLDQYTALAANDWVAHHGRPSLAQRLLHPPAVWAKWYLLEGGWKDGRVGWVLGQYAFEYTVRKLRRASVVGDEVAQRPVPHPEPSA